MKIAIVDTGITGMEHIDWEEEHQSHIQKNILVKNCQRCHLFYLAAQERCGVKVMDKNGFWENPSHTHGFAACDKCKGGERNPSGRTWQNGYVTLCEAHYEEMVENHG